MFVLQAQQHRTFNSAVAKQASMGQYIKPVYSLNGRAHAHTPNGLLMDGDPGDDEEADEEVKIFVYCRCDWK